MFKTWALEEGHLPTGIFLKYKKKIALNGHFIIIMEIYFKEHVIITTFLLIIF